jgi:hypothetical protein
MAVAREQAADPGRGGDPLTQQRGGCFPLIIAHGHGHREYRPHAFGANGNTIPGVHGVTPAKTKRRTLSLAALLAGAAGRVAIVTAWLTAAMAAGLALGPPAQASTTGPAAAGRVSVTITSMNPSLATAGATIGLSGTVTNGTRRTQSGLEVQLYTSAVQFLTRDGMDSYLTHGAASGLEPAGIPFRVRASLAPGATVAWRASFPADAAGMSTFGVYPVTAQVQDLAGDTLSADQTLLPYWPGKQAASLPSPLKISWLWPLIDQPHHQVCPALTSNELAASLGSGGRLEALLAAGVSHGDAGLTWVIDPALLSDTATMARPYHVGGKPVNCTRARPEPASAAAASWLARLRKVTAAQPTVITPYANVDSSALVHQGLTSDLATAYRTGNAVADSVLRGTFGHTVAWPPGGTADLSVLANLATAEHVGTVVLNSSEMPPADAATVFRADDAVASLRVAGLPLNVLLSDDTLTAVLKAGDTGSGTVPESAEFAVSQRFLAETAMIAAEEPNSSRAVVVAPPEDWSPPETLASDLLRETATAPWLAPTTLDQLSAAADTQRTVRRQPPPASKASPGELSAGYLSEVSRTSAQLGVYKSMLYKPGTAYEQSLDQALAATESAAWRGRGMPQGQALRNNLSRYLENADDKVKIITSAQVPMGGSSGLVPVSIQNGLHQAIQVKVVANAVNFPGRTSQLTIGPFQSLVIVPSQQPVTVRLPVSSAPQGSTQIQLGLTSADGTPLPFTHTTLTVVSTRYGRAILFLIGAAIGVLVLTSVYRGVRRWLHDDTHLVNEDADPPGSVVTGTSDALPPTEAPDDLADARRWVDDA